MAATPEWSSTRALVKSRNTRAGPVIDSPSKRAYSSKECVQMLEIKRNKGAWW